MSKSNKHHCMPDLLGEQKGDFSPFFHICDKEKLRALLLKERVDLSFIPEEDLELFSTFFHKGEQDAFWEEAAVAAEKRQSLAMEIQSHTTQLSSEILALAQILSAPNAEGVTLSQGCAHLIERVETKKCYIRTKTLLRLSNLTISIDKDNIFFQIEKKVLLLEIASKTLGADLKEWEENKRKLLANPPQMLVALLSQVLSQYNALERHVASQLHAAAKAAKAQNAEKYANLLYDTSRSLHDAATALKALAKA